MYKGFRLSFVSQLSLDIDRDVSTAYRKSASSGHSADSLSGAIYTTVNVSDWCITNLAHCWWVSILRSKALLALYRGRTVLSFIIYLFIYLTFLLDVTHSIIFTVAQRVKKSMIDVFARKTLNLKTEVNEGSNQTKREPYPLMRR